MKKKLAITMILLSMLVLSACGKTEQPDTPAPVTTPPVTETPETPTPEEEPKPDFEMTVEFITDEALEAYGDRATLLIASEAEGSAKVLLEVNDTVTDLRLWALEAEDADGTILLREARCVGGPVIVSPDAPAAVSLNFMGMLPGNGISYTAPDGTEKHCTIEISGKENRPILTEFTPAADVFADYDAVIEAYSRAGAEGWNTGRAIENGLSELFADCVQNDPRATAGYWKTDLNGDGREELLICANSESVMNSAVLFDVFTVEAGHTLRVCQSSARNRFYWCGEGKIDNIFSNSAFNSGRYICVLESGRLVPQEGVEFDSFSSDEAPWVKIENGERSPISEEEAAEIEMEYELLHAEIPLTAF